MVGEELMGEVAKLAKMAIENGLSSITVSNCGEKISVEVSPATLAASAAERYLTKLSPVEREQAEAALRENEKGHADRMRYFSTSPRA